MMKRRRLWERVLALGLIVILLAGDWTLISSPQTTSLITAQQLYTHTVYLPNVMKGYSPPGVVTGQVVDANTGQGIEGVTITVRGTTLVATTNEYGAFAIEGVPPGIWKVVATKDGFTPGTSEIVVEGGEETVTEMAIVEIASPVVIGSDGGSITTPDGTSVDIPPGALEAPTEISVTPMVPAWLPAPLPKGRGAAGVARFGPPGTNFAQPVTVTLALTVFITPGTEVALFTFNPETLGWDPIGMAEVAENGRSVTFLTDHFSITLVGIGLCIAAAALVSGWFWWWYQETHQVVDEEVCKWCDSEYTLVKKIVATLKNGQTVYIQDDIDCPTMIPREEKCEDDWNRVWEGRCRELDETSVECYRKKIYEFNCHKSKYFCKGDAVWEKVWFCVTGEIVPCTSHEYGPLEVCQTDKCWECREYPKERWAECVYKCPPDTFSCCGGKCYSLDTQKCCTDATPYLCGIAEECCYGDCCAEGTSCALDDEGNWFCSSVGGGSMTPVAPPDGAIAASVSPGGGELSFDNDAVTVVVPPGAVSASTLIIYTPQPTILVAGFVPVKFFTLEAYTGGCQWQKVTDFNKPVTIQVSYSPEETAGIDESKLGLYYFDNTLNEWVALEAVADPAGDSVTVNELNYFTLHFTLYALMAPAEAAAD